MLVNKVLEKIKGHPQLGKMGMIATHLGLVRETSLDGALVQAMEVTFDLEAVERIARETKGLPGIVDVAVECNPGRLSVGEEVMAVAVGGDTREHVFPALIKAVDRIKKEATKKRELRLENS
ncbi:MAG: molybdenum cofactor biosynthesis protein MoaE [Deltaproteobacteria bacterium]|nr:MAG: molybdenum cofactor biosynthesis protein MoaE [Deltaproteobacteria bacterium]